MYKKRKVSVVFAAANMTGLSESDIKRLARDAFAKKQSGTLSMKEAIVASGTFGDTTTHSPILIKKGKSMIDIREHNCSLIAIVDCHDTSVIKATHIVDTYGSATTTLAA